MSTNQPPRPSRPTTPLRRISSHSLRSLSLSHSQSRDAHSTTSPLSHLTPVFAELADSISDFVHNVEQCSEIAKGLDRFNEGFASYLYGLRTNSYTVDFLEAPEKISFELLNERKQSQYDHYLAAEQQRQQHQAELDELSSRQGSPPGSPSGGGDRTVMMLGAETTFMTNDDQSFSHHPTTTTTSTSRSGSALGSRGRGGGSGIARGRGRGTTRSAGPTTKRKKEEMAAFADPVFPLLPINLRENRRTECEKVLWALKEHPDGVGLTDLTKYLSSPPATPQVRINEVLLALVRAKVAVKSLIKGVNLYRLDESRFS